uniref:G-protein coupled receptors family 1 profile domain-containing protein n=1 Tax=Panagrolaimus sp. JU765 TaxID=591449 RepID=A0AC34R2Y0_9BILA
MTEEMLMEEIPSCSNGSSFTEAQVVFRVYLMPVTYCFGICGNLCNIYVFLHKQMISQLINFFLLSIAICDLCVLVSSFFVFSLPLMAEYFEDEQLMMISPKLLVNLYPFALTAHTGSVYLTILVSVHRYLGVCHPFLIRRISSKAMVKSAIFSAVVFSVIFNLPRFFEITVIDCFSEIFNKNLAMVIPTELFNEQIYTILYRNAFYTVVMFFFPFATLTWVNYKIISTLKASNQIRRRMTHRESGQTDGVKSTNLIHIKDNAVVKEKDAKPRASVGNSSCTKMSLLTRRISKQDMNEKKENGITIMLVAMVTGFLLFNMLAFFNNILELAGEFSASYTFLIELSTLLVNLNGATTIVIYLFFGTKYRNVFLKRVSSIFRSFGCGCLSAAISASKLNANEPTFFYASSQAELLERRRRASSKMLYQQSFGSN